MATYQAECGVHENGGGRMAIGADHEGVPVPESGTREARVVRGAPRMTRTIVVLDVDRCARDCCSVVVSADGDQHARKAVRRGRADRHECGPMMVTYLGLIARSSMPLDM